MIQTLILRMRIMF